MRIERGTKLSRITEQNNEYLNTRLKKWYRPKFKFNKAKQTFYCSLGLIKRLLLRSFHIEV